MLQVLGWLVLIIALELAAKGLGGGRLAVAGIDAVIAILMGLEASTLQRWTYSRRKWRQLDVIVDQAKEMGFTGLIWVRPGQPRGV